MPRPGLSRILPRRLSAGVSLVALLAASSPMAAVAAGPAPPRLTGPLASPPPASDVQRATAPATGQVAPEAETSAPPPEAAPVTSGPPPVAAPAPLPAPPAVPSPAPVAAPSTGAAAAQAHDDALQDLMPLVEEEPPRSRLNTTAWVGVGVTTLLLGVAAFYGASASSKAGDVNRLLSFSDAKTGVPQEYASRADQFEEDVRLGRRYDRLAKGFVLGAGVTALASAVLFVLDGSSGTRTGTEGSQARRPAPAPPTSRFAAAKGPSVRATVAAVPGPNLNLTWSF